MEKMTMLKKWPEEVLNLWNNWEIRGMVLLSLLLQTILIIFGSRRKTTGRIWIRILVWSAYLSADMVATVALSTIARSQGDSSCDNSEKANKSIQAFWAPFLLLHLGGPDTITAYSIEDNELWLRHLLNLVVQVGVAFYVFLRSWDSGILSFIAIPMFVVGIAKYAERTWVLWSSCSKSLKNSSLSDFEDSYRRLIIEHPPILREHKYHLQAYVFSYISKFVMQDLVPDISSLIGSRWLISNNEADGAFKVVEVELGLIYDMLYTKAPLIYSRAGIILRCISSLLSVTVFITFHFQVKIDKHDYSTTDIAITYLLFAAAVFLEFYAFLCLVLSDWTMIWLIVKRRNALANATYYRIKKFTGSKRWSRSISQYNLRSSSIENKPLKCLELLGMDEMMRQMHVNRKDLNVDLQGFFFEHLTEKAQRIKEDLNVCDKNHRSKIIGKRGDGVLEREGLLRHYKWCTIEVEFSRSILVWHLATDICYIVDNRDGSNVSTEDGRCLSEYMMYLLVIRPNMLSKGFGYEAYQATLRELRGLKDTRPAEKEYQRTLRELWGLKDEEYQRALRALRNSGSRGPDDRFQRIWKSEESVLRGVERLVRQLLRLGPENRWWMIREVWVEMVAYAAAQCPWKEHTQELRRGGELLTHVSLLMLHLGLSAQYATKTYNENVQILRLEERQEYFDARDKYFSDTEDMSGSSSDEEEEEEEYVPAGEQYLEGTTIMSGSSADEELKKLEKSKRELELKNQELERQHRKLERSLERKNQELERQHQELERQRRKLERQRRKLERNVRRRERNDRKREREERNLEQLRSSLTASTPQQGFDSLPISLPAQTDGQGTGQPPSNNEMRLSIE